MKHAILFVICLFLGSAIGSTETATFSLGSVRLANWARDGQIQKVVGIKLYDLIDGYADIHMGFNYVDSEHVKLRNGRKELEVSIFREDTPANAFGLYSCLRQSDGELIAMPDEASYSTGTAVLWRGPYCVEAKDVSEVASTREEILAVVKTIGGAITGKYQPPELVQAFPKENLDWRRLRYFHNRHPLDPIYNVGTENVLLLGADPTTRTEVEAVWASYRLSQGEQGILAIRYPDAEQPRKALNLYRESVRTQMASTTDETPWRVMTARNGKQTVAFQKDRLLILVFESPQGDEVKPIVAQIAKNLEPKK